MTDEQIRELVKQRELKLRECQQCHKEFEHFGFPDLICPECERLNEEDGMIREFENRCHAEEKPAAHNAEPWMLGNDPQYIIAHIDGNPCVVATLICGGMTDEDENARVARMRANGRRIVACINAFQGMPTEAIERAVEIKSKFGGTPEVILAAMT